ncbi:MAG: peroxiredoxin [Anaerolineae bacterium]|nr:peroxiredoxin [Anaerolineae bacterium]
MPQIGDKAPDFTLPNQDEQRISLSDYRGKKVIIFAFPKAGTAGCTMQACTFRDQLPQFENVNAVVLGISTDKPEALKHWKEREELQYDLLSDTDQAVLMQLGGEGMSLLGIVRIPMAKRSYWVIDEDGTIIDMQIGVGPKESVSKALEAIQQAQSV